MNHQVLIILLKISFNSHCLLEVFLARDKFPRSRLAHKSPADSAALLPTGPLTAMLLITVEVAKLRKNKRVAKELITLTQN